MVSVPEVQWSYPVSPPSDLCPQAMGASNGLQDSIYTPLGYVEIWKKLHMIVIMMKKGCVNPWVYIQLIVKTVFSKIPSSQA